MLQTCHPYKKKQYFGLALLYLKKSEKIFGHLPHILMNQVISFFFFQAFFLVW